LLLALGTLPAWFWLSGARAQTAPKVYRVGILSPVDREAARPWFSAFEAGLQELGYVAGQNIALEYRFADGRFERLPARAGELVRLRPDVLLVQSTPANLAAKQATAEIPIVMINVADPVGAGLVASLARPGGNITGITNISADLAGKRVELLKEIMPQLSRMAVLLNPGDPNAALQMRSAESAARKLNVELQPVAEVRRAEDLEGAILACVRGGAGAAIRMVDPLGNPLRRRTVELAARHRLPIIYAFREDAEAGGLVSYGTNLPDQFKRAATFVDRILKGAKPDELPVEQPTNFELVINMKAAKALGLAIPQPFLLRADKVIE
jgi:putative ABC transport system substrate-binding protein